MRLARWLAVARQLHDLIDLLLLDGRLTTPPSPDLAQLGQPVLGKARAPRAHRRGLHSQPLGDLRVRDPSPASSNASARWTCRCGAVWDRANTFNASRCPSDMANGAAALFTHADYH